MIGVGQLITVTIKTECEFNLMKHFPRSMRKLTIVIPILIIPFNKLSFVTFLLFLLIILLTREGCGIQRKISELIYLFSYHS